jgi:hypothetical protein
MFKYFFSCFALLALVAGCDRINSTSDPVPPHNCPWVCKDCTHKAGCACRCVKCTCPDHVGVPKVAPHCVDAPKN